jgi:TRAP-type mannitol/chloroaromatic compound transport system substrate-binding protein
MSQNEQSIDELLDLIRRHSDNGKWSITIDSAMELASEIDRLRSENVRLRQNQNDIIKRCNDVGFELDAEAEKLRHEARAEAFEEALQMHKECISVDGMDYTTWITARRDDERKKAAGG